MISLLLSDLRDCFVWWIERVAHCVHAEVGECRRWSRQWWSELWACRGIERWSVFRTEEVREGITVCITCIN